MAEKDLLNYRLLLLVKPDVAEVDYSAVVGEVCAVIEKDKGSVKEQDLWGSRPLAYKVNGFDKGYYAHLHFVATLTGIKNIDQALRLNERVLRYMITKD